MKRKVGKFNDVTGSWFGMGVNNAFTKQEKEKIIKATTKWINNNLDNEKKRLF